MKLPFTFGLKFVFRLLLPGFIFSFSLTPMAMLFTSVFDANLSMIYFLATSTIIFGWMFVVFEMHIYMFYEGRRYWPWPKFLRDFYLKCEERRLAKLLKQIEEFKIKDRARYLEISVDLRRFPMNDQGQYYVKFPTMLGNLIESYEQYPLRVYGMDSIFYWHRIWLGIDQDLRNEIDGQQALADSSVYISFALLLSGLIWLYYAVADSFGIKFLPLIPAMLLYMISIFMFLLSHIIYRGSLYLHAQFGETYKSLFDIHRNKVSVDEIISEIAKLANDEQIKNLQEKEKYEIAWRYMHNYRIKTDKGSIPPSELKNERNQKIE